ncbi:MAG: M48 family metallopeptidase [Gammaproteobacteria bacterium]|nr:M48 family metallopeptidase [Gammaproteobacteria bacterium]
MIDVPPFRTLVVAALAALLVACSLPLASESEIDTQGDAEFQKIRNKTPISTDARLRAYVNCVANAIVRELPPPYVDQDGEVEVFDSEEINAFALPGGHIGVFTGIFKVAENQDQLATVIGHEVAHVTEQHALKRYNREATTQIGVVGVAIATGTGQAGADLAGMVASLGLSLPFSRSEESEADTVGLRYMARAGFDPRQSVRLWQNMQRKDKLGPPEMLSTHPSSGHRIDELIAQFPESLQFYNAAQAAGKQPRCQR